MKIIKAIKTDRETSNLGILYSYYFIIFGHIILIERYIKPKYYIGWSSLTFGKLHIYWKNDLWIKRKLKLTQKMKKHI